MSDSIPCWFNRSPSDLTSTLEKGDIVEFLYTAAGPTAVVVAESDGAVLSVPFGASTLICKDPTVEAKAGEAEPVLHAKAKGHR